MDSADLIRKRRSGKGEEALCAAEREFPGMLRLCGELAVLREMLAPPRDTALSPGARREAARRLTDCRRRLLFLSRHFIGGTLGEESCRALLGGRMDSVEHLRLCAAIYRQAAAQWDSPVSAGHVRQGGDRQPAEQTHRSPGGAYGGDGLPAADRGTAPRHAAPADPGRGGRREQTDRNETGL